MGEENWGNLSDTEKQQLINDKKQKEKRLREAGHHDEADQLIQGLETDQTGTTKTISLVFL